MALKKVFQNECFGNENQHFLEMIERWGKLQMLFSKTFWATCPRLVQELCTIGATTKAA